MSTNESWYHNKWRPSVGWLYIVVVFFDFLAAPVWWSTMQFLMGQPLTAWEPITLQGSAMFHVAMLTIVGVTSYGRTQEKLKQVATDLVEKSKK